MNNCLVTKLKGSVNNPDFPYFGEFNVYVNSSTTQTPNKDAFYMLITVTEPIQFIAPDAYLSTTWDSGWTDTLTVPANTDFEFYFKPNASNYTVKCTSRYHISQILVSNNSMSRIWYFNINEMNGCTANKLRLWGCPTIGSLSNLEAMPNLTYAHFVYESLTGTTQELANMNNKFYNLCLTSSGVTGSIEDLSNKTSLSEIGFLLSNVGGEMQTFFVNQYNNGKRGILRVVTSATMTFGGVAPGNNTPFLATMNDDGIYVSKNSQQYATWTPSGGWVMA